MDCPGQLYDVDKTGMPFQLEEKESKKKQKKRRNESKNELKRNSREVSITEEVLSLIHFGYHFLRAQPHQVLLALVHSALW